LWATSSQPFAPASHLRRAAGELLGAAGTQDVIDGALVLLAEDGDDIVTSNPKDIEPLHTSSRLSRAIGDFRYCRPPGPRSVSAYNS
jgi:hypothetical protein